MPMEAYKIGVNANDISRLLAAAAADVPSNCVLPIDLPLPLQ